jgi:hypothetical protein
LILKVKPSHTLYYEIKTKKEHINHWQHYLLNLQCKPQIIVGDVHEWLKKHHKTSARQIIKIAVLTKHYSCRSSDHKVTHKSLAPNFPPLK